MTVPVPDQLEYISDANGVTKDFSYPKRFMQKDEVVVFLRDDKGIETRQILNTHYTIAGTSWPNGGTVSFVAAPQAPNKVVRYRMTQAKQTVGLANNQKNDAPSVELQLDRLTMGNQDTRKLAERSLKFPAGSAVSNIQPLPLPERGKALVGNKDSTGYINAPVGEGDIAVAVIEATEARDEAVGAKNTAVQSDANARASALTAYSDAIIANNAKNAAVAAATSLHNYDTLAQANADLANIPNNGGVNIFADAGNNGFYVKEAGVLVKKSDATLPAVDTKINQEIAVREAMVRIISLPGILAAITDDLFNSTFIAARLSDGKPTDYSRDVIRERIEELGWLPLFINLPGYRRVGGDEAGNLDWSCLRASDGKWPSWMYPQVAEALQPYLAEAGGGVGLSHNDRVSDGAGGLIPAMADMTVMSGWGSSGMYRARFQFAEMASELGASYYNGAWSGERSTHTAAKLGAIPALLTFPGNQIPASGTVTVTCSNVTTLSGMPAILGTVTGVAGSLVTSGSDWTWTRTTAGSAVPLSGEVPHLPSTVETYRGGVGVISTGKNDLTAGMSAEGVIARTDACFDHFTPLVKRVVVRGHFHNTGTPAVSSVRDRTNQVNVAHQNRYGPLFIDIEPFIFGSSNTGGPIWALLGLTPNSTDLAEMALRNLPPSLGADAGHFTTEASAVIVSNLIKPHLTTALNWY